MRVIRGLYNLLPKDKNCIVTIGNYDGVHLGHQEILKQVKEQAQKTSLRSQVIIFEPQPMEFFLKKQANARLMTFREKIQFFDEYKIDSVLCLKFNDKLATLSAEQFINDVLFKELKTKYLFIGDDFSFGCNRTGGFEVLEKYFKDKKLHLQKIPTLQINKVRVSSTHIRQILATDDFNMAKKLLGHSYKMSGKIIHGNQIGRTLGFPTANINPKRNVLPITGIFVVKATLEKKKDFPIFGIANIGKRPTINGTKNLLEVHLINFNKDIYGKRISIEFLRKIREEIKFDSLDLLKKQINQDVMFCYDYLSKFNFRVL